MHVSARCFSDSGLKVDLTVHETREKIHDVTKITRFFLVFLAAPTGIPSSEPTETNFEGTDKGKVIS